MYRLPQRDYQIRTVKGDRPSPVKPYRTFLDDDDSESSSDDIEKGLRPGQLSKELANERVESYSVQNKGKTVKLKPPTNRISTYIIKTDAYENYQTQTFRKDRMASPISLYTKAPDNKQDKYAIKNPFRMKENFVEESKGQEEEFLQESQYSCFSPIRSTYRERGANNTYNSNIEGTPKMFSTNTVRPSTIRRRNILTDGNDINDAIEDNVCFDKDAFELSAITIQKFLRGYFLRKKLSANLNFFYDLDDGVNILDGFFKKKFKKIFMAEYKRYIFQKKNVYLKNNLNLSVLNLPKIYSSKIIFSKFIVLRKELAETYQVLRKKKGVRHNYGAYEEVSSIDKFDQSASQSQSQIIDQSTSKLEQSFDQVQKAHFEDEIKLYKMKIKNSILRQLLILKMRKEERNLGTYFRKFLQNGYVHFLKEKESDIKKKFRENKENILKFLVSKSIDKRREILKRNFAKFFFLGIMKEMTMSEEEKNNLNKLRKLRQKVIEKEKEERKNLKTAFMRFYYRGIFHQMNSALTETREQLMRESLRKSQISIGKPTEVSIKPTPSLKHQPEGEEGIDKKKTIIIEDPTELRNKMLKKLVAKKEKDSKKFLHDMFMKFYYRGLYMHMVHGGVKKVEPQPTPEPVKPPVEPEKPKTDGKVSKARELRKLINQKRKNAKISLKIYFQKLYVNGVLSSLRKNARKKTGHTPKDSSGIKLPVVDPKVEEERKKKEEEERIEKEKQEKEKQRKERIGEQFSKFVYRKERDNLIILKNRMLNWNLRAKILRIKGLKKKKKPKKKAKVNLSSSEVVESVSIPSIDTPKVLRSRPPPRDEEEEEEEYYEDYVDNDAEEGGEAPVKPRKPTNLRASLKKRTPSTEQMFDPNDVKSFIMLHFRLGEILKKRLTINLEPYFNRWKKKEETSELLQFKGKLFVNYLSNPAKTILQRKLRKYFDLWEQNTIGLKRNIKFTLAAMKLKKIIEAICYKKYFSKLKDNLNKEINDKILLKALETAVARKKAQMKRIAKRRLYQLLGRKPELSTSSVLSFITSFKEADDILVNMKSKRDKKKFLKKLGRIAKWKSPIGKGVKMADITYYMKDGKKVILKRGDRIASNYLWRFSNPKRYFFKRWLKKLIKMKQKEYEDTAQKWEFEHTYGSARGSISSTSGRGSVTNSGRSSTRSIQKVKSKH